MVIDHEVNVLDVFHAFWGYYARREPGDAERMLELCAPEVSFVGTGKHEMAANIEEFETLLHRDFSEFTRSFSMTWNWTRTHIEGNVAWVEGVASAVLPLEESTLELPPFRLTHIYQFREGQWRLMHYHGSFPSTLQAEGSAYPVDALQAERARLEREVSLRTAQLREKTRELEKALEHLHTTQDQLVHADKMASLGRLTAGIAHEIRNPLNIINNLAGVSGELLEELREALRSQNTSEAEDLLADLVTNADKIRSSGSRADATIRSMLLHSRGTPGQRHRTDLNALVAEYVNLAYHGIRAQKSDFSVVIEKDFGEIDELDVVPQEIGHVLLNLLNNAFYAVYERFQQSGSETFKPYVQVRTQLLPEHVEIRVIDNGPGIAQSKQRQIFDPFFTTKPPGEGTGLGLSISYDIITLGHGGTLTVESKEGEGATFIITLPRSN